MRSESKTIYDERLVKYLLGQMDDPERYRFEAEYFSDDELFGLLRECEEWLIDEYLRGRLLTEERRQFERQFSASALSQSEVRLSRALNKLGDREAQRSKPVPARRPEPDKKGRFLPFSWLTPSLNWVAAAVTLVILISCGWLAVSNVELRKKIERLEAGQQTSRSNEQDLQNQISARDRANTELAKKLDEERAKAEELRNDLAKAEEQTSGTAPRPIVATLFLLPGQRSMGGGPQVLTVHPETDLVRLDLNLEPDDFVSYQADLRDSSDHTVWQKTGIKARSVGGRKLISLLVPGPLFKDSNRYTVLLNGVTASGSSQEVNTYQFAAKVK